MPTAPDRPGVPRPRGSALGVVAFSFGRRATDQEPNPCNRRLAAAVDRLLADTTEPVVLVAQWEVARALPAGLPAHVVEPGDGYLDTDRVWAGAVPVLERGGVERVVAVAQPLLHRAKAHRLIRRSGFQVEHRRTGWVGFDRSRANTQWWTRGPLRLALYAGRQALTGRTGR